MTRRRSLLVALCLFSLSLPLMVAAALPAGAKSATAETAASASRTPTAPPALESNQAPSGAPHIIPRPNSGVKPRDYGDRGGFGQSLLFFGICGAMAFMAALAVAESRRKKARRANAAVGFTASSAAPGPKTMAGSGR